MKKRLISLFMMLIMVISLVACGNNNNKPTDNPNASDEDLNIGFTEDNSYQYIIDKGTFILGFDDNFPPMGFRDDTDNYVGFDIDVAKEVAKFIGVELVLQPIDWAAKEQELSTKNIDCIWNGFSVTEERKANLTLSLPYMENSISFVVKKDSGIASMDDLAGKNIAVQAGSSGSKALDNAAEFKSTLGEVNEFRDYVTALMDLETNNSHAVIMDSVMANYMINEAGKDFIILEDTLVAEEYAIGFRKGEVALKEVINSILREFKADGTIERISTEWFGSDITIIE